MPMDAMAAFRVALEDRETAEFMRKNFSRPEDKPEFLFRKKISKTGHGGQWTVELIEKIPAFNSSGGLMNVARIAVDPVSGTVVRRQFFRSILADEYRKFARQSSR